MTYFSLYWEDFRILPSDRTAYQSCIMAIFTGALQMTGNFMATINIALES